MARVRKALNQAEAARQARWLAAVYIRLSREDGGDESYSVTNQKQRLMAFYESLASEEPMQLAGVYIDDGFTGTDSERGAFQRMLRDLDEGRANCIIVKDLSRLSRNDWECKRYLQHLFVLKDIRFISLELPRLDSYLRPDEIYDLGVTMQSAYNENHCRETSIKVRGTFDAKRRAGEFIGAFAPYGYMKDPADRHRLAIDPAAAPVVRDVFHWFVREGMSKNGIVRRLAGLGIPCPTAYKQQSGMRYHNPALAGAPQWSARSVTQILENRMYLGHMVQGKQKVRSYKVHTRVNLPEDAWFVKEDTHEPIIDDGTFQKARDLMLRDTRTAPNTGKLYPFSGFLRCADCGKSMCRRESKGNVYYACRTKVTTGQCTRHSIRHDRLEGIVLTALQKQIDFIDSLDGLIDSVEAAPAARLEPKRLESALKAHRQALEKAALLRTGLYADWKNGDITREEYHAIKQSCEQKEEQLRRGIAALEEACRAMAQSMGSDPAFDSFRRHRNLTELNRGIIAALIKVIYIHEGGDVDLEFAFACVY